MGPGATGANSDGWSQRLYASSVIVGRYRDVEDLVHAQEAAALLGPAQQNNVSADECRYPAMPGHVVNLGQEHCKLSLRGEIERWRSKRPAGSVR